MDRSALRELPAVGFAALLLVVSLLPAPETGGPTPAPLGIALDKWVHAGSYGVLAFLLSWGRGSRTVAATAVLAALAVGYGVGIELLQTLVPSRSLSVADVLANAVGAVLGALAWAAVTAPSARAVWRSEQ
ncbi:VanZ family protein [Haloarcula sp. S1CR25-12]|uniref:VanZ family protein n=1 Tax=Haloarcula saliterrae TaxID=2950534 RepID=A0ABU2FBZ0_9EURY|nr:VanZ family protein [Haloarcula sp. S1CR25-12]MDS0259428.1 VanZ family protein [Haloarcula sp. S1CR25-12]